MGIVFGEHTHWPIGDWKFRNVKELGLEPGYNNLQVLL
jgi:hypothetical protein